MVSTTYQDWAYLSATSTNSPSRSPTKTTFSTPNLGPTPDQPDPDRDFCPHDSNKACACHRAGNEKRKGIVRTAPVSKTMQLSDRESATGKLIEKGPMSSVEASEMRLGRYAAYLMSLCDGVGSAGELEGRVEEWEDGLRDENDDVECKKGDGAVNSYPMIAVHEAQEALHEDGDGEKPSQSPIRQKGVVRGHWKKIKSKTCLP